MFSSVISVFVPVKRGDSQQTQKKGQDEQAGAAGDDSGFRGFPGQRPSVQQPAAPKGRTLGEVVSLRLEMAAYFRRSNVAMPVAEGQQQ